MADVERPQFHRQRAKPIAGPGGAPIPTGPDQPARPAPQMVQEPPARQLRSRRAAPQPIEPTPPEPIPEKPTTLAEPELMATDDEPDVEPTVPISDVFLIARYPQIAQVLEIFHGMDRDGCRAALHILHKTWPQLFS